MKMGKSVTCRFFCVIAQDFGIIIQGTFHCKLVLLSITCFFLGILENVTLTENIKSV